MTSKNKGTWKITDWWWYKSCEYQVKQCVLNRNGAGVCHLRDEKRQQTSKQRTKLVLWTAHQKKSSNVSYKERQIY